MEDFMKKTLMGIGLAVLLALGPAALRAADKAETQPAAPQAKAEEAKKPVTPGPLDGKSFVGEIAAKGQKANADTFLFKDGRFRSTACDKFGFKDAAYTTSGEGKNMRFRATTVNPSGAKMEWDGMILGNKLEGTAVLNEQGKPAVENTFKAKITK
jgi:opacity protein-like surface antigen